MPKELPAVTVLGTQRKLTDMHVRIDPLSRAIDIRFGHSSIRRFSDGETAVRPHCWVSPTPEQIAVILTPALHDLVSELAHRLADEATEVPPAPAPSPSPVL